MIAKHRLMGPLPLILLLLGPGVDDPQSPAAQPVVPVTTNAYTPITGTGRLDWAVKNTIGPASLWIGAFEATWQTGYNHPEEYGRSFTGWGKRYGLRLTGVGTSSVMEAGLGAIWGEDPRYHPADGQTTKDRFTHAFKMTVLAERRDGHIAPAYARFIAIGGSNIISDAWRPNSDRTAGNTVGRIGYGFLGEFLSNLWSEFWPSIKDHLFWNKH